MVVLFLLLITLVCDITAGSGDNSGCPLLPEQCWCFSDGYVSCSDMQLRFAPMHIPTNTTYLDLGENQIESIPYGALTYVIHLQQLKLGSNKLTDAGFTEQSIVGLDNLTLIDISGNIFYSVPMFLHQDTTSLSIGNCFIDNLTPLDRYTALQSFDFSGNRVTTIQGITFSKTEQLTTILASRNKISSIESRSFENLRQLSMLMLDDNKLTSSELNEQTFIGLWSLRNLSLSGNPITEVPNFPQSVVNLKLMSTEIRVVRKGTFSGHNKLQWLFLGQNALLTVEAGAFFGTSLWTLDMQNIRLVPSVLHRGFFEGLESAYAINLNNASVGGIEPDAMQGSIRLFQLWLFNNQISTLDEQIIKDLNHTQQYSMILLSQNPWWCDCNLRWLKLHTMKEDMRPAINDPYSMLCAGPPPVQDRSFSELSPQDFNCV